MGWRRCRVDRVDGKDRKHAPMGVFSVLAVRDGEKTPNSQNVPPLGAFWLFGVFLTTPHGEHRKHTPMGVFSVFAVHPIHPLQPRLT